MAGDKTAALMACSCSIGAVYLGAPPALAMGLAAFGAHAGLAFQLTDDLLGIWGAPEITGKPVRSDLRTRKKSLPVVAALASDTDQGRQLGELLAAARGLPGLARAAVRALHGRGDRRHEQVAASAAVGGVVDRSPGPPWKLAQVPSARCLDRIQRAAAAVSASVLTPRNWRSSRSSASMVTLVSSSPCHQPGSCCRLARCSQARSSVSRAACRGAACGPE